MLKYFWYVMFVILAVFVFLLALFLGSMAFLYLIIQENDKENNFYLKGYYPFHYRHIDNFDIAAVDTAYLR